MRKLLTVIAILALFTTSCKKETIEAPPAIPELTSNPPLNLCTFGNCWSSLTPFPATISNIEGSFVIDNTVYLSYQDYGPSTTYMWQYNTATGWSQSNHLTTPQTDALTMFSIGNKGYTLFSGFGGNNKLYEFDPATGWIEKNTFPGSLNMQYGHSSFVIGTKGYITGHNFNLDVLELWEYDQTANTWTKKSNVPKPSGIMPIDFAFSVSGKGYVLFKVTQLQSIQLPPSVNLFWSYDPVANIWSAKGNYPGDRRVEQTGFVIGNVAYVGTGKGAFIGLPFNTFKKYEPATNSWTDIANYAGGATTKARGFAIGSRGYLLDFFNLALPSGGNYFYQYRPKVTVIPL